MINAQRKNEIKQNINQSCTPVDQEVNRKIMSMTFSLTASLENKTRTKLVVSAGKKGYTYVEKSMK